ncbi:hypothetical protein OS493_035397 [Desmophyllum pertusum]|uniref:Uncharacterized protein n=1 Tax=Desmophyllum pertusum TaxID=174260 RepID=A0A9W9ZZG1_9CNID|nr:hypothetical protein OS493_035397 [Desmophyllum pertusum]
MAEESIVGQNVAATTTITTRCATQTNTPYQYQASVSTVPTNKVTYTNPHRSMYSIRHTMLDQQKSSEPPPPYSGAAVRKFRGSVCSSKTLMVLYQNPSAPLLEQ